MTTTGLFAWSLVLTAHVAAAFVPGLMVNKTVNVANLQYVSPDMSDVLEPACLETARLMKYMPVPVPSTVHPEETVDISFVQWQAKNKKTNVPLILVHGFDSSCLEYRRFGSVMAERGVDTYAVDLLGWGFTQLDGVESFSADAKIAALSAFIDQVTPEGGEFCIAGASLGGAAAIEVASKKQNCAGLVLLDAQGFVDGIGPMSLMPKPVARLGVEVLKSIPLRSSANQMSYFDKEQFATDDAVTIGRLHCLREGWNDALVSFMGSGGFSPSKKLANVDCPSLVVWGRQDGILEGEEFVPKFLEALPDAEMQWIEECGHVPHLEKPGETADAISSFVTGRMAPLPTTNSKSARFGAREWLGLAGVGASAAVVAEQVLQ